MYVYYYIVCMLYVIILFIAVIIIELWFRFMTIRDKLVLISL